MIEFVVSILFFLLLSSVFFSRKVYLMRLIGFVCMLLVFLCFPWNMLPMKFLRHFLELVDESKISAWCVWISKIIWICMSIVSNPLFGFILCCVYNRLLDEFSFCIVDLEVCEVVQVYGYPLFLSKNAMFCSFFFYCGTKVIFFLPCKSNQNIMFFL